MSRGREKERERRGGKVSLGESRLWKKESGREVKRQKKEKSQQKETEGGEEW